MYELGYDPVIIDVVGFEELYQISEDGHIYDKKTGKEKKCGKDKEGYLRLNLFKNSKQTTKKLHRLLAEAFVPNPENKECVDHMNRNKDDNRLENLRWATISENNVNRKIQTTNTSGFAGIYEYKNRTYISWRAQVNFNKKRIAKYFPFTDEGFEDAKQWRIEKSRELHGEFSTH